MTTNEDIQGQEYDWLAIDSVGHVGLFSTAGGGFAPDAFLEDTEAFDTAIAAILSLPPSTLASCNRELPPGLTNTWRLAAERGLYAFDSDPLGGPYRRIAAPHTPIAVADLPPPIRGIASRVVLPGLTFADATEIAHTQLGA
jgi:hypothetical protein